MPNRTITKSGGGDFTTFTAAIAAAGTLETFDVIEAGVYTESARLLIAKSMAFVNTSGGDVSITQATAQNLDVSSASACVVEFTDIDFVLAAASATFHYNIGLLGAGTHTLKCTRSKFTTAHLSNDCLPVYHADQKSHQLTDCEIDGHYDYLLYSDGAFINSTVDGLTITQAPISGVVRATHATKCVEIANWRRWVGPATRIVRNTNARTVFDVGTSGLFTTSALHHLTAVSVFGTGAWTIEKSTLQGAIAYGIQAGASGVAFAGTFRDMAFIDFATAGIEQPDAAVSGMVDYCGRWNCPAFCSKIASVGTHIVTTDPLFVDETGHDYRLQASSAYRDAGTACVATVDPDGNTIPQEVYPDIGAYERLFVPPLSPLQAVDNSLRRATDIAGVAHIDPVYEIVPTTGTGTLTDIRHLLMVWAGTDKRVQTQELPADMRDVEYPDNHGWMADPSAGNRLWLFDRRPLSSQVDMECQLMMTEDLLWLTTDGIAASYTVAVTHTGRRRDIEIGVKRLDGQLEKYGVADLWENRVV